MQFDTLRNYIDTVVHVKFTYVFVLSRNLKNFNTLNPGRDRSVTTTEVSNTNQLKPSSDLIRSLYL